MTFAPVTTLGPYEVLSQLGSGGMGVVYTAHDPRLDRHVAIRRFSKGSNHRATRSTRRRRSLI